jgi:hypothetical protein
MLVIALAICWHGGLTLLIRSRRNELSKPSIKKLLKLAELDILATLRGEMTRLAHSKPKLRPTYERKLRDVDVQMKNLGETDEG